MTDDSITLGNETINEGFAYFVRRVEVHKEMYITATLVDGHYILRDVQRQEDFGIVDEDKKDEAMRRVKERAESHLAFMVAQSKTKGISF
jgi:hypothetical protein